ncbi:MAG: hypothetical protein PHP51_05450 [Desulfotomaculaceae bacterium]|nr:hypothetical protein [Desulfotomaculaceae bacterium]MDD4767163.1 hypothetical protein [Desulfotomaculaceae bacterium]
MNRRRSANRKFKEKHQPEKQRRVEAEQPSPKLEGEKPCQGNSDRVEKQAAKESDLPLAVILEILATEYGDGRQGDALCRAAVRLAEESGEITGYRARWDEAQEDSAGNNSAYLFDRRQAMELIRYHQNKGNSEALNKEKDKLRIAEGRLLLGQSPPLRITDDDLEKLEEFIKGHGF